MRLRNRLAIKQQCTCTHLNPLTGHCCRCVRSDSCFKPSLSHPYLLSISSVLPLPPHSPVCCHTPTCACVQIVPSAVSLNLIVTPRKYRISDIVPAEKVSWWGCGKHIPSVMDKVPREQRCTCGPSLEVDGKMYPPKPPGLFTDCCVS